MGRRLKARRGAKTLQEIANKIGSSASTIQRYENGRIPDAEILEELAKIYGVTARWLLTGEEGVSGGPGGVAESAAAYEILRVDDKQERLPGLEKAEMQFKRVPILEEKIAAGPGSPLDFQRIEDWARIPSWKLKRTNAYYMIRVTGRSMEPQLRAGDLILVNLTRRDPNRLKD